MCILKKINKLMKILQKKEEIALSKNYKLYFGKKIGRGAFGEIYKGEEIATQKKIAIKCEFVQQNKASVLKSEIELLNYLKGSKGIPELYMYIFSKNFNFMLFELLGPNINEIFNFCHKKFSLPTVLSLGLQMLNRIEYIHSLHIIHRDIKPENFLTGKNDKISTIYLCDFGLAKRFRDKITGNHIPYVTKKPFVGTPTFASVYGTGTLPWKGLKMKGKDEKYSKILYKKMNVKSDELLKGLPNEFMMFLQNVRDLQFEQKPDYEYLKGLLRKMNTTETPLENIKLDYIDYFEKVKIKHNNKYIITENSKSNKEKSKMVTKSNTSTDSHNDK